MLQRENSGNLQSTVVYYENCTFQKTNFIQRLETQISPFVRKEWMRQKLSEWCKSVKKWGINELDFDSIGSKTILKQIHHISFHKLNRIILWKNNIQSFQCLCLINLPEIKILNLGLFNSILDDNFSISIKSLRKLYSRNIQLIQISFNPIKNAFTMAECLTSDSVRISLDYGSDAYQVSPDPSFLTKMQCLSIPRLKIASQARIYQPHLFKIFRYRFNDISIEKKQIIEQ